MKKLNVIYICLCLVLIYSACSCGARKVNSEHSKEETQSNVTYNSKKESVMDTNVKTITTTTTDDKNETVTEETIMEPVDASKESFLIEKDGTKIILNNTKKTVRKTTKKNNTRVNYKLEHTENTKKAVKEQKSVKQVNASKKENKSKEVKREPFKWYYMFLLLIPVGVIYYFWRKYKNLTNF